MLDTRFDKGKLGDVVYPPKRRGSLLGRATDALSRFEEVALRESDLLTEEHWRWRLDMCERIASSIDPDWFGVVEMWVFGSTKNATAGSGSDIDLLVHFRGGDEVRTRLLHWLERWSLHLAHINYLRTGFRTDRLLDVHLITDKDLEDRTSFAVKAGAVTDGGRPLKIRKKPRSQD